MTAPLPDDRLAEIRARHEAATPGPWEPCPEHGPKFYAYQRGEHLRGIADIDFGQGYQAEADEAFVIHAEPDMAALLAEVARLREANDSLGRRLAASVARIDRLEADVDRYNAQRDEARAEVAELEAAAYVAGAAALRSASLQMSEGCATGPVPSEVRTHVSAWLTRLATEHEARARTARP